MQRCVVLNADYSFLNVVDWRRAICLVVKEKVKVLKYGDAIIHCGSTIMKVPAVIMLLKLVRHIYKSKVPFTKKNIFIRDRYECAYCGTKDNLTIDHIIPQSRGGKTDFDNCVAACRPCNNLKNNRTPSEAKMFLRKKAYQPTIAEFLMIKLKQLGVVELLKEMGLY
jgi:5-methylcytosine-specific restriction endonuclease McrA